MMQKLYGQIERITYVNEENGYTVAKLKVKGERSLVTVVGTIPQINAGEVLEVSGEWANHPKFGSQFKISEHRVTLPSTVYGIEKYLASGLIKGIGPVMGKRLVKKFSEETLEIIDNFPERLREVDGIGAKRLLMIKEAWESQRKIRDVMVFLQGHGISSGYATKIFKQYGKNSIAMVQENPYRLARDIHGIGFITADKIATNLGIPKDSIVRSEAGIMYVLYQMADEGHVYYPYEELIEKCRELLDVDLDVILKGFAKATTDEQIVIEDLNEDMGEFRENNKAVYMTGNHIAEAGIARKLKAILNAKANVRSIDIPKAIEWVQKKINISLAENQIDAIKTAFQKKIMVLTGGPGTGKTTIIRSIIEIFKPLRARILLSAPTGRAAKRMSEATGNEAKTIHRLLEYGFQNGWKFKKDNNNPLEVDVIVVDEISMIDNLLMYYLLKAVPLETIVILVGDSYQLPSVGAGNVLKDIIDSQRIPVVELSEIFRQAAGSLIITNAHRIKNGRFPEIKTNHGDKLEDFYFIERESPEDIAATIIELATERIPKKFSFNAVRDIQVITPMNKGIIGTTNLNIALQNKLNTSLKEVRRGLYTYRTGDKVMQISNNYDKDVFNGDIGYIKKINLESQTVTIDFDDRDVIYDFTDLDELVLAYAISIHKSQGSEYPAVIIPIHTQHYMLLQRNLIYTAITRGKKLAVLVGTKKALQISINNNKTKLRHTMLRKRLSNA